MGYQVLILAQQYHTKGLERQQGIVLIASLLMISILLILVLALAIVPIGDLKIANNTNDMILAKQASLGALEEAKQWVVQTWANNAALPLLTCGYPSTLRLQDTTFNVDGYQNQPLSWWTSNGCMTQTNPPGVATKPYYIIKYLGCDGTNGVDLYQIIVRGTGVSNKSVAYSEAIVKYTPKGFDYLAGGGSSTTYGAVLVTATRPGATIPAQGTYGWYFYGPWQGWMPRNSQVGFFQGGWGWGTINWNGWCPLGLPSYSGCVRNCAGLVRVYGLSGDDNPPCEVKFGPWVGPGGTSSVQVRDGDGILRTFSCSQ